MLVHTNMSTSNCHCTENRFTVFTLMLNDNCYLLFISGDKESVNAVKQAHETAHLHLHLHLRTVLMNQIFSVK